MIHIEYTDLSGLEEEVYQKLYALASPQRQQRADRYLRKEDAHRCIVAEALLRHALGADSTELSLTPEGKPFLPGRSDVHFNLSHSGRWVVIAWGDQSVGIDVEMIAMNKGKEQLARHFFHAEEQDYLFAAQDRERALRFYEIWTKKESYLKYLGTGINRALSSFSVLQPPEVSFSTHFFEDALCTLCAKNIRCEILPVTVQQLLSE